MQDGQNTREHEVNEGGVKNVKRYGSRLIMLISAGLEYYTAGNASR